jgi:hypothetical protein
MDRGHEVAIPWHYLRNPNHSGLEQVRGAPTHAIVGKRVKAVPVGNLRRTLGRPCLHKPPKHGAVTAHTVLGLRPTLDMPASKAGLCAEELVLNLLQALRLDARDLLFFVAKSQSELPISQGVRFDGPAESIKNLPEPF